ncbi:MAG TPA: amidohydrolase family protein [Rhizobiaceae bacterium]|nr:amidohydrolase family protein [Rhizobiaceae bacterium]
MSQGLLIGCDPASGNPLAVSYAEGRITSITEGSPDARGFLSAGLVDLQVNGFAGYDLNAGGLTEATVSALTRALTRSGVTTFVPTLITAPEKAIAAALATIAAARRADPRVAHAVPYVHIEGPWLSPEDGPRGAHPKSEIRTPDLAEFDRWQDACGGLVGMVTLSPHWPNSAEIVRALVAQGIHVAIGHTEAEPGQVKDAIDAGARLSTHLGNGAAQLLPRHPNFIWTQLADERLSASLIADGHHLPADTFKVMLRAKGLSRAILVSDATTLAGMPPGIYEQPIGGKVELSADGRLSLIGTPYLAGAALPLSDMVARAATMGGIDLDQALALATVNPGGFVGRRGRLEVGSDADLIRFDWTPGDLSLSIDTVLVRGESA